jgi:hypothetical protein
MTRQQALEQLGEPKDWLGKKTVIGETCEYYHQSDLWFYYEGSVGVGFDDNNVAERVNIYPGKSGACAELFQTWPAMTDLRIGQWRAVLETNGIVFREGNPNSLNYWIIAGDTCVAFGWPSRTEALAGKEIVFKARDRVVEFISKYSDVSAMEKGSAYVVPDQKKQ